MQGMYSILIKSSDKKYAYHTNTDGSRFSGNDEAVKARLTELLNTYPISALEVVHNVVLTPTLEIEDVA